MTEQDKLNGYRQELQAMCAELHLMMRDTHVTENIATYHELLNLITLAQVQLEALLATR